MVQGTQEQLDFAYECKIRDYYAATLSRHRGDERLIATEARYETSPLRVDMRTITSANVLHEWEFKLFADYRGLGQVLTYVALAREASGGPDRIRGVLAAFEFSPEVEMANETLNLGLELVRLPKWMRQAGGIPQAATSTETTITIVPLSPIGKD